MGVCQSLGGLVLYDAWRDEYVRRPTPLIDVSVVPVNVVENWV